MRIKNFETLATTALRREALGWAEAGLEAIDTAAAIRRSVRGRDGGIEVNGQIFPLAPTAQLIVVGVGKCALDAAAELESVLGDRITGGLVIDVRCDRPLRRLEGCAGDHPLPSQANVDHTKRLLAWLERAGPDDLVLAIVSGGGSTLLCQPHNFLCHVESELVSKLFVAGARIQEINLVRKHLSIARGGFWAKTAYPARLVGLIFSDVPGDDIGFIASGPTVRDVTTVTDAAAVLRRFGLTALFPPANLLETPKDDHYFSLSTNFLIVSNQLALEAMARSAAARGFQPTIAASAFEGEAAVVGRDVLERLHSTQPGAVLLFGGESHVTTFTAGGHRRLTTSDRPWGGRNQELALAVLPEVRDNELVLTLASDGWDNTPHAGAIADKMTRAATLAAGLRPSDFLDRHESFAFFERTANFINTGRLGSNVADLIIAVKAK